MLENKLRQQLSQTIQESVWEKEVEFNHISVARLLSYTKEFKKGF